MGNTELVVALDYSTLEEAEGLIAELEGLPVIYKVGLELFLAAGPDWIRLLSNSGERVFLDLKFHDIPSTVGQAVLKAIDLQADFLTLHLTGGQAMLDEVQARIREAKAIDTLKKIPKILGISILGSFQDEEWKKMLTLSGAHGGRPIEESVLQFSSVASEHEAVNGMICSPHELAAIRSIHPELFLMVSGIRPKGSFKHDQQWTMTPHEAKLAGASAIIVGRPIRQADNSREMTEMILAELSAA
jgi:orotidine-5'-phosphate decarboxylase